MGELSYDDVPYDSRPFYTLHPDPLSCLSTLFGLSPAPVETGRVLEIGCSQGGHLLPIAAALPNAECVGVDISEVQIRVAQERSDALGLTNVRWLAQDLRELDPSIGEFDTIIAHGVFSWVAADVREALLAAVHRHLAPHGVAMISYNVLPGFYMRKAVREVMQWHLLGHPEEPDHQERQVRALMVFLARLAPERSAAARMLYSEEHRRLQGVASSFVLHGMLADHNRGFYIHEFVERAHRHDLSYFGDVAFHSMFPQHFPEETEALLARLATDQVSMDQYMDALTLRMFRQSLVCRSDAPLDRTIQSVRIRSMRVSTTARFLKNDPPVDPWDPEPLVLKLPDDRKLVEERPIMKALHLALLQAVPRSLSFDELCETLQRDWSRALDAPLTGEAGEPQRIELARSLLHAFASAEIRLSRWERPLDLTPGDRPVGFAPARVQAASGERCVNLWHHEVRMSPAHRRVLMRLDGRHRDAIAADLADDAISGEIEVRDADGATLTDRELLRPVLVQMVDEVVTELASWGLLVQPTAD